jgi:hypothetical protein
MVFIIDIVRGKQVMAVHRGRGGNVRALGEDDGLMSWGGGINETWMHQRHGLNEHGKDGI